MRPVPLPHASPRPDVRAIVDGLRERRGKTQVDRGLVDRVRAVFEGADAPSVQGLHFYVFQGAVSVYGAVASYRDREAVMDCLAGVPGITQIADHLTVLS